MIMIECQRLKAQVVQEIRANQQLEQDLNIMDIKIGLLVKNRITLQVGAMVGLLGWGEHGGLLFVGCCVAVSQTKENWYSRIRSSFGNFKQSQQRNC